jgi:hypothetical protein
MIGCNLTGDCDAAIRAEIWRAIAERVNFEFEDDLETGWLRM